MTLLITTLRRSIALALVAAALAPLTAFAKGEKSHSSSHASHGSSHSAPQHHSAPKMPSLSKQSSQPKQSSSQAKQTFKSNSQPTKNTLLGPTLVQNQNSPFANGNMGIAGTGTPPKKPSPSRISNTPPIQPGTKPVTQGLVASKSKSKLNVQTLTSTSHAATSHSNLPPGAQGFSIGDVLDAPGKVVSAGAKAAGGVAGSVVTSAGKVGGDVIKGAGNIGTAVVTGKNIPGAVVTSAGKVGGDVVKGAGKVGGAVLNEGTAVITATGAVPGSSGSKGSPATGTAAQANLPKHDKLFTPITKLKVKPTTTAGTTPATTGTATTTPGTTGTTAGTTTGGKGTTTGGKKKGSKGTGGSSQGGQGQLGGVLSSVLANLPIGGGFGGGAGGGDDDGSGAADYAPAYAQPSYAPAPQAYDAQPVSYEAPVETGSADLVLIDAKLVKPATALAGPAYAVRFRNQGLAAAGKFIVAGVASTDGQYRDDAPKAMLEMPGLAAGQTKDVVLRMPRGEYGFLILAVDANGSVSELDKDNNTAVVEVSALAR